MLTRRDFVKQAAIAGVAAPAFAQGPGKPAQQATSAAPSKTPANPVPVRVGMTDPLLPLGPTAGHLAEPDRRRVRDGAGSVRRIAGRHAEFNALQLPLLKP